MSTYRIFSGDCQGRRQPFILPLTIAGKYATRRCFQSSLLGEFIFLVLFEYHVSTFIIQDHMTKKDNYLAAQNKESKPQCDLVVVFTDEELELIREEAFKRFSNGKPVYQQSAAYFLMLNTGLRAGELCGIINSNIDLENRVIHLQRGVKEVHVRDGLEYVAKLEVKVGKLKSKTSKRDVPLNDTAVEMIQRLREEVYLGEDKPLISDENGNFTNPRNMRNRFYRILDAIGLPHKGQHTFRHTFATRLINGVKQPDGSVKSLSVKQVAELLGHTTSEITEIYYVKRDTTRLVGLTDSFNL